jgi:hypothetical protein
VWTPPLDELVSQADESFSESSGVPGYVAEYNDSGPDDTNPSVEQSEETFEWYTFTQSSTTAGTQTADGTLSSSSGC